MTSRKRKKGKSEPTNFVYFKNDTMKHRCNNFFLENELPDLVVAMKRLTPLDKPCSVSLKMQDQSMNLLKIVYFNDHILH